MREFVTAVRGDSPFDSRYMQAQPLLKNSENHYGMRREQEEKYKKTFEDHKEQVPIGGKRVLRDASQQQSEMFNAPRFMSRAAPDDFPQNLLVRPPPYKVFKLISTNRKTGIQSCRAFEIFRDSDICDNLADRKVLERNLIETQQDDDVDTDDDILESAHHNCLADLN